jgi:hypothetical protein
MSTPSLRSGPPPEKRQRVAAQMAPLGDLPADAPFCAEVMHGGAKALRVGVLLFGADVVDAHSHNRCRTKFCIRRCLGASQVSADDFSKLRRDLCPCPTAPGHAHADDVHHVSPRLSELAVGAFNAPATWRGLTTLPRRPGAPPSAPGFGRPFRK